MVNLQAHRPNTRAMDRGIYIAASGMVTEMVRQDQIANDLANVSTPGYKQDRVTQSAFGSMLLSNTQTGQPVGTIALGTLVNKQVTDMTPAPLTQTNSPLDMGIVGTGFFALKTPQGTRYTRDGSFQASNNGTLTDQLGNPVLGPGNQPIKVATDGTVNAKLVGVFALKNPVKVGDSNFSGTVAGKDTGTVQTSMLEGSGVDPARVLVDMETSLRAFESGQKVLNTLDDTLGSAAQQVGSLNGS
jgi:flagellar basal-body rod protein FlgF